MILATMITDEPPMRALPVCDRKFLVSPMQPVIYQVTAEAGALQPIDRDTTLVIRGQGLQQETTFVRIGTVEAVPNTISANQLRFSLTLIPSNQLRAGVQNLQVVQRPIQSRSPILARGVESNPVPFILRPTILAVQVIQVQGHDEEPRSAQIQVQVDPPICPDQQVVLILNQRSVRYPLSYIFNAPRCSRETQILTIPVHNLKPAEFLVRLRVDGAESLLTMDANPNSPTFEQYIAPSIVIE